MTFMAFHPHHMVLGCASRRRATKSCSGGGYRREGVQVKEEKDKVVVTDCSISLFLVD
jgi:hypothetical protein